MSILKNELFKELEPFFHIQIDGSAKNRRIRIEFKPMPLDLQQRAQALIMPCVACGRDISPIRRRDSGALRGDGIARDLYYAATCRLVVKMGCARTAAARIEYDVVENHFMGAGE